MKIRTCANYVAKDCEEVDQTRVTDGSQYKTIGECVQMVARGEAMELHDYTQDNPFDRMDEIDVADNAQRIIEQGKAVEEKLKKDAEPAPEPQPEPAPTTPPEPAPQA